MWLEPWSEFGLELLRRNNVPEMMTYLGGPETEEQLVARHQRYLEYWRLGTARMFRVVISGVPQGVGLVGYWRRPGVTPRSTNPDGAPNPHFRAGASPHAPLLQHSNTRHESDLAGMSTPSRLSRTCHPMPSAAKWASDYCPRTISNTRLAT